MTPLILSADDFGQHDGIDAAVLDLAARGRLTATSCLTTAPRWSDAARSLTPEVRARIDVGVHIDLTEFGATLPWSTLVFSAYARRLPRREVQGRIAAQLDAFEDATGAPPDYVDGHRHVHQLPQVRSALLIELERRYAKARPWIRISRPPAGTGIKGAAIGLLGSRSLATEAATAGYACSGRLLGVYGFHLPAEAYATRLEQWLQRAESRDVLMVHVARSAPPGDVIGRARIAEYEALGSDAFAEALERNAVRLVRGRDLFTP